MIDWEKGERDELLGLFRRLSPPSLPVLAPELPASLAARADRTLPRRPRALLFDLYGTLFASAAGGEPASREDGAQLADEAADDAGSRGEAPGAEALRLLADELEVLGFAGGPGAFAAAFDALVAKSREKALLRQPHPEVEVAELAARLLPGATGRRTRRAALLLEAWRNPCAPMPGARELLLGLRDSGLRLGIVSNAQFYSPLLFEALLGAVPEALGFEEELCSYSFELRVGKPGPEPYLRALGPLLAEGLGAGEVLMLGNSYANDVRPAAELGLMTVLFSGDARSFRPGKAGGPEPDSVLGELGLLETLFPSA